MIRSKRIGSRKDQTRVYFNEEKNQIICGCYTGTLKEFKFRVKKTYKDIYNPHRKEYLQFIRKVENFIRGYFNE